MESSELKPLVDELPKVEKVAHKGIQKPQANNSKRFSYLNSEMDEQEQEAKKAAEKAKRDVKNKKYRLAKKYLTNGSQLAALICRKKLELAFLEDVDQMKQIHSDFTAGKILTQAVIDKAKKSNNVSNSFTLRRLRAFKNKFMKKWKESEDLLGTDIGQKYWEYLYLCGSHLKPGNDIYQAVCCIFGISQPQLIKWTKNSDNTIFG
jgi:hypothetical protein